MVGGEKTSLGGEYVGGEIVPWWRDRSLVASLLGGEVTGYPVKGGPYPLADLDRWVPNPL